MATFKVERWKTWKSSDPSDFYLVPPESHPYAWLVPRWWYKGRTVYETCAQVQGPDYIMYIDGVTPGMELEFSLIEKELTFTSWRDIRRVVITPSYSELLKEDGEFADIELTVDNKWIVRRNTLPDPIIDILPEWIDIPVWGIPDVPGGEAAEVTLGNPASVECGDFNGGMPPITFRGRWQVQDQADAVFSGPWQSITPHEIVTIANLEKEDWWPEDYKTLRFMNQVRDTNPTNGNLRNSNKFVGLATINTPVDLEIDQTSSWINTNVYEPGEIVEGKSATFTGGAQPVDVKARFQKKIDGAWESGPWKKVSTPREVFSAQITESGEYRFQTQATDDNVVVVTSGTALKTVEACTPLANLPDLGSGETSTNMCDANGPYGYADVQGLPLLPS